jgi:hypothetical protein
VTVSYECDSKLSGCKWEQMLRDTGSGAVGQSAVTGGHKSAHSPGVRPPCPLSHHFPRSAHCSTLKTGAALSSENWYSNLNIQSCENSKFHHPVVSLMEFDSHNWAQILYSVGWCCGLGSHSSDSITNV